MNVEKAAFSRMTLLMALLVSIGGTALLGAEPASTGNAPACDAVVARAEALLKGTARGPSNGHELAALVERALRDCNNGSVEARTRGRVLLAASIAGSDERDSLSMLQEADQVLREDAPRAKERVIVLEYLATNWLRAGAFDLATTAAEKSALLRRDLWGSTSPEAIDGRTFLSYFFMSQSEFRAPEENLQRARREAQSAVDEGVAFLGSNARATMRARVALASALRAEGQRARASEIMEQLADTDLATLSEDLREVPPGP